MKCLKAFLAIFIVLILTVTNSLAGGGIAGKDNLPCPGECGMDNPGSGALALKGTIAVEFHPYGTILDGLPTVDFALRLERSGDQFFYRGTLQENIDQYTDEQIVCLIVSACEAANQQTIDTVKALVDKIIADFFGAGPGEKKLAITANSVSDTDFETGIAERGIPGTDPEEGIFTRALSIANVKLYAVDNP